MSAAPPIRVHVLIDGLGWGGAEMLLADLASGAPAAGLEMSVGYLFEKDGSPAAARLRARGIEPVQAPVTGLLKPSAFRSVRRQLSEVAPDVLHTHLGYSDTLGGAAARSLGLPAVSTIHVMEWERGARERTKLRINAAVRRRSIARTITVSEVAREAYLAAGLDRPSRVVTVHNGIEGRARPGAGPAARAELGLAPDDLVVAMVSVLRSGKGHDVAMQAALALRERFPRLRLLIVGDGPLRAEVERRAASLGGVAVVAGHRDDVMAVLDGVDVLLHPSLVDAFPTALLEAMAAAVPVVATSVGGIPEIVEDGSTGTLIEAPPRPEAVAGALLPLLADAGRRTELGRRGRERFEREFSAQRWAERLRGVYETALAERPRRPARSRRARTGRDTLSRNRQSVSPQ